MRKIKFLGRILETGEIFPISTIWGNSVCLDLTDSEYEYNSKVYSYHEIELLQFTGIHDDADVGKELFEGHKVELEYEEKTIECVIKFEAGGFMFVSNEFADSYIFLSDIVQIDSGYAWIPNCKVVSI